MVKKIFCVIIALLVIGVTGCDLISKAQSSDTTIPSSVKAVREAKIGQMQAMKQMQIDLESEVSVIVTLAQGNTVDGFFYLEKGENINFSIAGTTSMYVSPATDPTTGYVTSDRFAFAATQEQGLYYNLTFKPVADASGKVADTVVFLELVYPVTGTILVPLGTK